MSLLHRLDTRRLLPAAVALSLASVAALLFWNAFHYEWTRGYDAWAIARYVDVVQHGHRLPTAAESDVWHNPPFFFVVAAGVQELASWGGWRTEPYKAVQLLSAASGVILCLLAFLTARELWPRSATAQVGALVLAAGTPVLVRGSAQYHPEALTAVLAAGALFVVIRACSRNALTGRAGLLAGLLLALANLTRTWALAALAAVLAALVADWWWRRDRAVLRFGIALLGTVGLLLLPWLGYKTVEYGSPLAYSRPNAEQWHGSRPLAFYTALDVGDVFTHPYYDHYRNHLLPVVYSDWWGDYWRSWRVPTTMAYEPAVLPGRLDAERRLQSYVGVLPTLLVLVALGALAWQAVRRRSAALLVLTASVLFLAVAYTGFLIRYPKQDGDNMKALYVLNACVPLAVCGGWALDRIRRLDRLMLAGAALLALLLLYFDLRFLVLP